jgi:hypothetical protein
MSNESRDETLFLQLVAMFQYAAMQQMGKIPNPVTGKIERDLMQARMSIDMIEMLQRRAGTGRSPRESEYIDRVLFELRMNYVDESKRPDEPATESPEADPDALQKGEGPEGE